MRGLAYLEWRHALNQWKAIARSPARLALWLPYAAFVIFFAATRLVGPGHARGGGFLQLGAATGDVVVGIYAGVLGVSLAGAAGGRILAFRSPAEAVLFVNAGIRPLHVAIWLQARRLLAGGTRWFASFAYVFVLLIPPHAGALVTARAFVAALLAIGMRASVDLPAFLIARRARRAVLGTGSALALAGFALAAVAFFRPDAVRAVARVAHADPGAILTALLAGNPFAFLLFIIGLAALAAIVALQGDDALPELYAASRQMVAYRSRAARADGSMRRLAHAASSPARRIPAGALAIVWKDWAGFRRVGLRTWLVLLVVSAVVGAAVAYALRSALDPGIVLSVAATLTLAVLVLAPLGASAGIANDLGNPLFRLARAPLRTRVAAWTFANAWRPAAVLGLAPFVAGLLLGNVALFAGALPVSLATYWSLQCLGVGLFAAFPNPMDARGPIAFVRSIALLTFGVPPGIVAIAVFVTTGSPFATTLAGALAFALEGWLVLELASLRFAERGASLATQARAD